MQTARLDCDTLFLEAVSKWLSNASMMRCDGQAEFKIISGDLIRPEYQAKVDILFCPSKLKKLVPKVYCSEPWIKREIDWHCLKPEIQSIKWQDKPQLCWIYPTEWSLAHNHLLKRLHAVVLEGAEWLRNNVTKLLDCHWVGHVLDIKNWRSEWGGWAHGKSGTKEFWSEKKAYGLPSNWCLTIDQ